MTKIYALKMALFFVLLSPCATVAQWLPNSNAVWSVWQEKYFLNGDSVLNGTTYQKVA